MFSWLQRTRTCKRLYLFLIAGAALLWLIRSRRSDGTANEFYVVGQSSQTAWRLSLGMHRGELVLRLDSPDGKTHLRGTLNTGGEYVVGAIDPCFVDAGSGTKRTGACTELTPSSIISNQPLLRLELAYSEHSSDCYTVKWRAQVTINRGASVTNCFELDKALWYGGPQVFNQRWPINSQGSQMQPHTTGDYLLPEWRSKPGYGKYGSLAEPYWLSSAGVGIIVTEDRVRLSSSFNSLGDGRLCLKGDLAKGEPERKTPVEEVLSYTICHGEDVAVVNELMSTLFIPKPKGYPDVQMMRKPIWSTWAQYKANVNQAKVEEMAERILSNKFPHRYRTRLSLILLLRGYFRARILIRPEFQK